MKSILLATLAILLCTPQLFAQSWTEKQFLTGTARYGAIAFSLHDKGYVGLGDDGTNLLGDLWQYDPATDAWIARSAYPGSARRGTLAFATDEYAYVGTGWTGSAPYYDFFRYDAQADSWTAIAPYPGERGRNCMGTAANGKGYVGGGSLTSPSDYANDFWEYDPTADSWTQRANFPFGGRAGGVSFAIEGIVYVGMGQDGSIDHNDFWAYTPATNSWMQVADFPGPGRLNAGCFVANGKAVVGGGYRLAVGIELADYFEYDPATNSWATVPSFSAAARSISAGFTIDNTGYLATGWDGNNNELNDLWAYESATNVEAPTPATTAEISIYPVPSYGRFDVERTSADAPATFVMFNTLGAAVLSRQLATGQQLLQVHDLGLPTGTYYFRLTDTRQSVTGKVLVVR